VKPPARPPRWPGAARFWSPAAGSGPPRLALLALLALACGGEAARPPRPNLLLVTIDTLRADALGAYGQPLPTSPEIDRLAAEGILFEQCASSSPSTLPSHATLFTGREPWAHGVRSNAGYRLPPGETTLAEALREAGYRTGAEVAALVMGRETRIGQGFESFRDPSSPDAQRQVLRVEGLPVELPERAAGDVTRHAVRFLEEGGERPFFLWVHYFEPHSFYAPPDAFRELVPESLYHGEVRFADHHVGRLRETLERLGLAEHTLLVVTSDHGEGLGEHGENTHSFYVYDSTLRVPLVLWSPRLLPQPRRVASLVRSLDLAPTLLELLGAPPLARAQGVSLAGLATGAVADLGLTAYGESLEPQRLFGSAVLRSLRQGRWKYVHQLEPALYDLAADPRELDDRAAREPARTLAMRQRLAELLAAAPPAAAEARAALDPAAREALQALGYFGAAAPLPPASGGEDLELRGPSPPGLAADLEAFANGWAELQAKRPEPAEATLRALWQRHPRSGPILHGLLAALAAQGPERSQDRLPLLRRALELDPSEEIFVELAGHEADAGREEEARRLLGDALAAEPCAVSARIALSQSLHRVGRFAEQRELLEAGLERCPASGDLRNDLAWLLATCPEQGLRDGPRALLLAQQAVSEAGDPGPAYLDTLAAAHAEVGDFAAAAAAARRGLARLEERGGPDEVVALFRAHLAAFEAGRPVRE